MTLVRHKRAIIERQVGRQGKFMKHTLVAMLFVICRLAAGQSSTEPCALPPDEGSKELLPCEADSPTCDAWRTFRGKRPYPYQSISVLKAPGSGQYTVIVSEAPPIASQPQVAALVAAVLGVKESDVARLRYPQGLDGWLEDIAITVRANGPRLVPVASASGERAALPAELVQRLDYLNAALFGTSDGFYVDVDEDSKVGAGGTADLKITTAEVLSLASDRKAVWHPLGPAAEPRTFDQLAASKSALAAIQLSAGIVALNVPGGSALASIRGEFRRFAIASDYLVGAVRTKANGLLLLARTRVIPLRQLPPLRFETFASLTSGVGQALGQSYERQRVFAGKIGRGLHAGWDWAPIYLSAQLQDTEFGALLDIADQQLKSWSECGHVHYAGFDYLPPSTFPFVDQPASAWMFERTSNPTLIFNWNTQAFASSADTPVGRVITVSDTGALPVSYIVPEMGQDLGNLLRQVGLSDKTDKDAPSEASAKGSKYFAALGDAILARVVQNVFLYQALGEAKPIRTDASERPSKLPARHDIVAGVLRAKTKAWLAGLPAADLDPIRITTARAGVSQDQLVDMLVGTGDQARYLSQTQKDIQLKVKSFNAMVDRINGLIAERDRLIPLYDAAFIESCRRLNGTLVDGGSQCAYTARQEAPEPVVPYADKIRQLDTEINSMKADSDSFEGELNRRIEEFALAIRRRDAADHIAADLKPLTSQAETLDDVLSDVVRATALTSPPGSIRTPSVVLSRNSVNTDSVGGHNIDGLPWLIKPLPGKGRPVLNASGDVRPTLQVPPDLLGSGAGVARGYVLDAKVEAITPRELNSALELPKAPEGSFLAKLRDMRELPDVDPDLKAKADACYCDYFVQQGEGGVASMVRLKPPPSAFALLGDTALAVELSKVKPGSKVVFDGFGIERAMALTEAGGRRNAGRQPTFSERIDEARNMFVGMVDSIQMRVRTWASSRGNTVHMTGPDALLSPEVLQSPMPWKQAQLIAGQIADGPYAPLPQVAIVYPERGARIEAVNVIVHGDSVTPEGLQRSVKRALSAMQIRTALQDGAGQVVDQIYKDAPSVRSVEFHLKGAGLETRLMFPQPDHRIATADRFATK
jgi:hypothetical protein